MIWEGKVYFLRPKGMKGPVKIGCSRMHWERVNECMRWSPFPLEVAAIIPGELALERAIHDRLAASHSHREWFHPTEEVCSLVEALRDGIPIQEAIDLSLIAGNIRARRTA